MERSKLIVIAGPSGSGKTTIVHLLRERNPEILFSVSATTRPKRATETHGKDYYFITREEFEEKIRRDELAEWEEIYGDYYGSLKSEIERAFSLEKPMVFDVDVRGALSIKNKYPDESVLIFLQPPNLQVLSARLKNRRTESSETVARRLERTEMELRLAKKFDHCIVNDLLERTIAEVDAIVKHEIRNT